MVMGKKIWSSTPTCYCVQSDVTKPEQHFALNDYMVAALYYQNLHTYHLCIYTFSHNFSTLIWNKLFSFFKLLPLSLLFPLPLVVQSVHLQGAEEVTLGRVNRYRRVPSTWGSWPSEASGKTQGSWSEGMAYIYVCSTKMGPFFQSSLQALQHVLKIYAFKASYNDSNNFCLT